MRGSNAGAVIARINPIIRGWSAYYRGVVSSKMFSSMDHYMWRLTCRWARHTHPKKPKKWIVRRYFGRFNKFRNDRWVFGDPRPLLGDRATASPTWSSSPGPHRPAHAGHGRGVSGRPRPGRLLGRTATQGQTPTGQLQPAPARQAGRPLPAVRGPSLTADQPPQSPREWERWWLGVVKRAIAADYLTHYGRAGRSDGNRTRLIHASCHRSLRARERRSPADRLPATPSGLA